MRASEIEEGDQFIGEDGRVFWTATGRAHEPSGDEVYVPVRESSGRETHRWLPVGVDLPVYRLGRSS